MYFLYKKIPTAVVITFKGHSCGWENFGMLIVIDILYVLSFYVYDMGDSIYQVLEKIWYKWSSTHLLNYHAFFICEWFDILIELIFLQDRYYILIYHHIYTLVN